MSHITGAFSSFAVGDLSAATLGLQVSTALPDRAGPLWIRAANERGVLVYSKPDHVPASFTVLNLEVDDVERAVDDLTARGVTMERYPEYPQDARGIYHGE